jgi:hypothetical protein
MENSKYGGCFKTSSFGKTSSACPASLHLMEKPGFYLGFPRANGQACSIDPEVRIVPPAMLGPFRAQSMSFGTGSMVIERKVLKTQIFPKGKHFQLSIRATRVSPNRTYSRS